MPPLTATQRKFDGTQKFRIAPRTQRQEPLPSGIVFSNAFFRPFGLSRSHHEGWPVSSPLQKRMNGILAILRRRLAPTAGDRQNKHGENARFR